jgi:hypothetical protein
VFTYVVAQAVSLLSRESSRLSSPGLLGVGDRTTREGLSAGNAGELPVVERGKKSRDDSRLGRLTACATV